MTTVGLVLIAIGWIIQLNDALSKKTKISPVFIAFYAVGVLFVSISGYQDGHIFEPILNAISLIAASFVFLKLPK